MIANAKSLVIVGPTASGKSSLAMSLAEKLGGEIVNCDSVQVYRGFEIGAAKPPQSDRQKVPHHLLDIKDWNQDYDARQFAEDAKAVTQEILARGKKPILVGGTGLYLRAYWGENFHENLPKSAELRQKLDLLSNLELQQQLADIDPIRASELHINDRYRLLRALELVTLLGKPVSDLAKPQSPDRDGAYVIYIRPERKLLHERIATRTTSMLKEGFIEEVRHLLAAKISPEAKPMQAIGYKQVVEHLNGQITLQELPEKIMAATRQYAKRQIVWFNKIQADLVTESAIL